MGDGYMLVFPSVRQGLACALDFQAIDFDGVRTRAGVHAGEAVTAADDFFGHSVTMAARVASAADGGSGGHPGAGPTERTGVTTRERDDTDRTRWPHAPPG